MVLDIDVETELCGQVLPSPARSAVGLRPIPSGPERRSAFRPHSSELGQRVPRRRIINSFRSGVQNLTATTRQTLQLPSLSRTTALPDRERPGGVEIDEKFT